MHKIIIGWWNHIHHHALCLSCGKCFTFAADSNQGNKPNQMADFYFNGFFTPDITMKMPYSQIFEPFHGMAFKYILLGPLGRHTSIVCRIPCRKNEMRNSMSIKIGCIQFLSVSCGNFHIFVTRLRWNHWHFLWFWLLSLSSLFIVLDFR